MTSQAFAEEFVRFFQDYLSFYRDFLQLETDKFNDISANRVEHLDDHVKTEEAFMLKSRGLELKRDRLVTQAGGSETTTFRELIPRFDSPYRDRLQQIFDEFSVVIVNLKEINLRCNYITELKLHRVQTDIKKLENRPELQKHYDAKAKERVEAPGFISKKV